MAPSSSVSRAADNRRDIYVEEHRKEVIAKAISTWAFSAHDFTDDELLYSALLMLKHALQMPEVEQWGMTDGVCFVVSCSIVC